MNHRKNTSKRKAHNLVRRKLRRSGKNVNESSATFDSMRACRRLYGQGLAK